MRLNSSRYYGYLTGEGSQVTFHVLIIVPPNSSIYDWIGQRRRKTTDLLCLDDFCLSSIPNLTVDWSGVRQ